MTCTTDSITGATSIAQLCAWIAADGPHTNRLSDAEVVDLAYRLLLQGHARITGKLDHIVNLKSRLDCQHEADAVLDAALAAQDALTIMRDHARPSEEPTIPPYGQRRTGLTDAEAFKAGGVR